MNFIQDFSYPSYNDPDLQQKIFKKREFYYHLIPKRNILESYDEIEKFRNENCKIGEVEPKENQIILPNYINPNTPYKGILLMYGTGAGKTMTAIRIAEQFKDQVKKYNTKIHVLVPGPTVKENFKKELIKSTGDTYIKNKELLNQMSKEDVEIEKKIALNNALQYYKFMSYKSFQKKVIGERIIDKSYNADKKNKSKYRKNEEGEIEREIGIDKIVNLNNSVIIIDEAHNITDTQCGLALHKIIKNSTNLRIILLTATPMINLADEIVELLNFIRPIDDKIERDKIFSNHKNYEMQIKPNGLEYLKEKARGYISYYRGSIPYTFAKRVDIGKIPDGLLFTPVIKCNMEKFQYDTYINIIKNKKHKIVIDTLDKATLAISNFVFPGLSSDKTKLCGYYSNEGINTILSQLNTDGPLLRSLINKEIFNNKLSNDDMNNFIIDNGKKNINGLILKLQYIKYFSIKFYTILNNLSKLYNSDSYDSSIAFIYSNLVKAGGIELFAEMLLANGYLEYAENGVYDIKNDTIDYKTGLTYEEYKKKNLNNFKPATFILIIGSSEEHFEELPEIKQKIIQEVFNNANNKDGKYIKLLLGSKVMGEGITLQNCKEVHIIDSFYNIPTIEQVIGRVIRLCAHQNVININNKYPSVNVYKYVISLKNELSSDELLYQKAEIKYLTIKEIERALKESAFDCPLLLHSNMFPEEIEKYKDCVYPTLENIKSGKTICPALCDFKPCTFKCESKSLNNKLWDKNKLTYKLLSNDEIDYNTFNNQLAEYEIISIKNKIKDLFRFKHVWVYEEILSIIKKSLSNHQSKLFDENFIYQALNDLMPKTENDFNIFKDTIHDKYNKSGYVIKRGIYYIFQPFNENENVSYYYRKNINIKHNNLISIDNYVNYNYHDIINDYNIDINENDNIINNNNYNFNDVFDYYNKRKENFIIGIIDKNLNKFASEDNDLFKIRPPNTINKKKRGVGIYSFKGAVCSFSKDKQYLVNLIKKIPNITKEDIDNINKLTKEEICNELKNKLLYLEKYSTSKDNNKITYVMIPKDHPIYPFPYNLEDRIKYIIEFFSNKINKSLTDSFIVKKKVDDNKNIIYHLYIEKKKLLKEHEEDLLNFKFKLENNNWIAIID